MAATQWFTVSVTCDADDAGMVADLLWRSAPPAVEERSTTAGQVVLIAGYPDESVAVRTAARVTATERASATVVPVVDDGLDAWRAHARVERAGRFVVVPPWLDHSVAPGEIVLRIDPGRTFGSGSHPTTRLVLERLEVMDVAGHRVLDVGCGSGVLSVAAAAVGAEVVGIDVDPDSPEVVRTNARANRVAARVEVDDRPLSALANEARATDRRFDVVLANLLSPIIVELADDLATVTAPGGRLVVSGLLADDHRRAIDALTGVGGLHLLDRFDSEGWTVLTLEHPPARHGDPSQHRR